MKKINITAPYIILHYRHIKCAPLFYFIPVIILLSVSTRCNDIYWHFDVAANIHTKLYRKSRKCITIPIDNRAKI